MDTGLLIKKSRRRVLKLIALSSCVSTLPYGLSAKQRSLPIYRWDGKAMGAETSIQLFHEDEIIAKKVLSNCVSLIQKYENIFSLFKEKSDVVTLNKNGLLNKANPEFIQLINLSKKFHIDTDGAFDISIQPLWNLYEEYFTHNYDDENLKHRIDSVMKTIGSENIVIDNTTVAFQKKNMAISFNGIAQGYMTDKIAEYLRSENINNTLIDIGEYRANGPQSDGQSWQIGLLDPFDGMSIAKVIEMDSGAVATSGGYGLKFDQDGKHHHIFNPTTGLSSHLYASVTVKAENATEADALSTAFCNMPVSQIEKARTKFSNIEVYLTSYEGNTIVLS